MIRNGWPSSKGGPAGGLSFCLSYAWKQTMCVRVHWGEFIRPPVAVGSSNLAPRIDFYGPVSGFGPTLKTCKTWPTLATYIFRCMPPMITITWD